MVGLCIDGHIWVLPKTIYNLSSCKNWTQSKGNWSVWGYCIQLTEDGEDLAHMTRRHHGAAFGSPEFAAAYVDKKVAS